MQDSTRGCRRALLIALFYAAVLASPAAAARAKSANFVIHAPTQRMADEIARAAEYYRRELAIEWTGKPMPDWGKPCPVHVKVGDRMGAGGATTFSFDRGEVFGWKMEVQGSMQRILDSVLPHEVSHTIFACYFRRPLPRWADEGAATLVEHESERRRQTRTLSQVIRTSRRIPLRQLLTMTEYPTDMEDVLTLYAEGYSLADLLVQEKGKATYLKFLADGHRVNWAQALKKHYGYRSIADLEARWHGWVMAGSPALESPAPDGHLLAGGDAIEADSFTPDGFAKLVGGRGQSPDAPVAQSFPPVRARVKPSRPVSQPLAQNDSLLGSGSLREVGDPVRDGEPRPTGRLPRRGLIEPVFRESAALDVGVGGRDLF